MNEHEQRAKIEAWTKEFFEQRCSCERTELTLWDEFTDFLLDEKMPQ